LPPAEAGMEKKPVAEKKAYQEGRDTLSFCPSEDGV
jgi:hypothetical protein